MSFRATATKAGNSRGLRLDAGLYKEHPEFASGEYQVDVIAPGRLLVRADTGETVESESADPVLGAFLAFMESQMQSHPDLVSAFDPAQLALVDTLVDGVVVDDENFPVSQ